MTIRVAYDIACLGQQVGQLDHKMGIFRVTEEVMYELAKQYSIDLTLVGLCGEPTISALNCLLYFNNTPDLSTHKYVNSLSSRLGLKDLYTKLHATIYLSDSFYKLPKLSPQALIPRSLFKLLREFDARHFFDDQQVDLLHSPYHKLPSQSITKGVPRLLTVHDLIPILAPEFVPPSSTAYLKQTLNSINQKTDWVVCNSEYTRQEFCDYTGMSPERTFVTPLAAASHFHPVTDSTQIASVRQRYGIPDGNYFLSLATLLDPRKNLAHLIRCFFQLLSQHPDLDVNLVLAGSKRVRAEETIDHPDFARFGSRIIYTGYVADEDLSAVYSDATAFIYPSLYEGFGLPPLEAMKCGTPVITSNTTSLPEVVGNAGILVDPKDEAALGQAMLNLLTDSATVQALRQKGFERSQQFSWAKCTADTVDVYKKIVAS